jgi:hypothetical protein
MCLLSVLDMLVVGEADMFNEGMGVWYFHEVISVRTKATQRINGKVTSLRTATPPPCHQTTRIDQERWGRVTSASEGKAGRLCHR